MSVCNTRRIRGSLTSDMFANLACKLLALGLQVFAVGGLVATLLAIAIAWVVLNRGDVSSLPGYSPGTTSAWTRDEGWTVTYANGTVSKQEGDGWTVTTGGSESEEYEDD